MREKAQKVLSQVLFFAVIIALGVGVWYIIQPRTTDVTIESQGGRDVVMRTVLSRDAIPAIDNPQFLNVENANRVYRDDELILGVNINGDARAYSVPLLSRHEIVNDTVGGHPIAVTW